MIVPFAPKGGQVSETQYSTPRRVEKGVQRFVALLGEGGEIFGVEFRNAEAAN